MWLTLLQTLLSLVAGVAGYVKQQQLMDAGSAEALAQSLQGAQDAIDQANRARANVRNGNGLPIAADPNNRDNKK